MRGELVDTNLNFVLSSIRLHGDLCILAYRCVTLASVSCSILLHYDLRIRILLHMSLKLSAKLRGKKVAFLVYLEYGNHGYEDSSDRFHDISRHSISSDLSKRCRDDGDWDEVS
jgi:hypothetical protein